MDLSDLYSSMDRDPDEQPYIAAEMTGLLKHNPVNAQVYFHRGNARNHSPGSSYARATR